MNTNGRGIPWPHIKFYCQSGLNLILRNVHIHDILSLCFELLGTRIEIVIWYEPGGGNIIEIALNKIGFDPSTHEQTTWQRQSPI